MLEYSEGVSLGGAQTAVCPAVLRAVERLPAGQTVSLDYGKSDAYAVGSVCYQMCTGGTGPYSETPPPEGAEPVQLPARFSDGLRGLLRGLVAVSPADRMTASEAYEKAMMLVFT